MPMKMSDEHFQFIKEHMTAALERDGTKFSEILELQRANPLIKDAEKAARWLLFFAARSMTRRKIMSELYSYLEKKHVDTAIRRICKEFD